MEEKLLEYASRNENFWQRRDFFTKINPLGTGPVLVILRNNGENSSKILADAIETIKKHNLNKISENLGNNSSSTTLLSAWQEIEKHIEQAYDNFAHRFSAQTQPQTNKHNKQKTNNYSQNSGEESQRLLIIAGINGIINYFTQLFANFSSPEPIDNSWHFSELYENITLNHGERANTINNSAFSNYSFMQDSAQGLRPEEINNKGVQNTEIAKNTGSSTIMSHRSGILKPLLPKDYSETSEIYAIIDYFNLKIYEDVVKHIIYEKITKTLAKVETPNSELLRLAKKNFFRHLGYLNHLLEKNFYLCGDQVTLADFAAAAHFSIIDYVGDIDWHGNNKIKNWYALLKSRSSMRKILKDKHFAIIPPKYYDNPDF